MVHRGLVFDGAAELRVGGVHGGRFACNRHRLRLLARLQGHIDANILADLDQHVLAVHRLEAAESHMNGVSTGGEVRCGVSSGAIGGQRARHTAGHVGNGNGGAHDGAAGLIGDGAVDASEVHLGERRSGNAQKNCKY